MPTTRSRGWQAQRRRAFFWSLVPAILILVAITVAPAIYLFLTSLTPLSLVNPKTEFDFSDPIRNYREALEDQRFVQSVWIQARLSFVTVLAQVLLGLGIALLLNARSRFLEAVRTAFLIPMVLPPIVVALIWKVLYTPEVSPVHRALRAFGMPVASLITRSSTALMAIAVADTWQWFPFTLLIILASLQMIPDEPLEAAKIDGAGACQAFLHVVLPFIRPAIVLATLFRLIDSIKAFPLIFVLTEGGPGSATQVTNYYAYIQAFTFSYWGYASAIATMLVAGIFLLSWLVSRLDKSKRWEE
jgi:multiple sugar transport system permease protein